MSPVTARADGRPDPAAAGDDDASSARSRLHRGLTVRHIQFMALGSAIGTGLFYGSSSAIQAAGPAVLLAYVVAGAAVLMVMRAMGEMTVRIPVPGAFSEYAAEFLGPFAGYVTGWTYVFESSSSRSPTSPR